MNQAQLAQIVAAVVSALNAGKSPKVVAKGHKKLSSYKTKNKYEPKGKILSDGKTERQIANDVAVAKAFAKQGFTVIPRVDALTYKGWLSNGKRVIPGQHGIWVKGVGTLFHSGQVVADKPINLITGQSVEASIPA